MSGLSLSYRKALITGASSGLGKALVEQLLQAGVEVWGTSRDLERLSVQDGFHAVELELEHNANLRDWYQELDKEVEGFDLIINNAGFAFLGVFENLSIEGVAAQLDVNLRVPIELTNAALNCMRERKKGAIVNVSSLVEQLPVPFMAVYNSTKSGLSAFSRSLMLEAPKSAPWIIDFCPGDLKTNFNSTIRQSDTTDEDIQRYRKKLDAMLANAPSAESAAIDVLKALAKAEHQVIRSGSFFQSFIASSFVRFIPTRFKHWLIRRYFKFK